MSLNVTWILFDFGGCLDSDGLHSRQLFLRQFIEFGFINDEKEYPLFQDAYSFSDKKVIGESLIVNANLLEMNEKMCFFIAEFLKIADIEKISKVAAAITDIQAYYLRRNKRIIADLKGKYSLGIISNFSGNLIKILDEFSLTSDFDFVLDSYHIGFSKPDLKIFEIALSKTNTSAEQVCFIGDNVDRDILPAKQIGMKTILIHPSLKESIADYTLNSLLDLPKLTQTE